MAAPQNDASNRFEAVSAPLGDYGGFHRSSGDYFRFAPASLEELRQGVREAAASSLTVRIRGAGHSMNGSAVPRAGELLIDCRELDGYAFLRPGTIEVGAGATVWDVHQLLRRHDHELLVYNDGDAAASTVGGYVSAGGFGANSWAHGGFWETVLSLQIVTVDGSARTIGRDDPLFRWLFGSMGQLAVIAGATLVARRSPGGADYPLDARGRVERSAHQWEPIMWFSVFVPRSAWHEVRDELASVGAAYASVWQPRPVYAYSIPFRRFTPPLLHSAGGDLVAVGIWGEAPPGGFDRVALRELEEAFRQWLARRPSCRRYAAAELLHPGFDWQAHFGRECHAAFARLKRRLDPRHRLGAGLF